MHDGREMDVLVDAETGAVLSTEMEDNEAGAPDDEDGAGESDDDESGEVEEDGEEDDDGMAAASVPQAVTAALRATHPRASDVEWSREDGDYEASFSEDGSDVSVAFASGGAFGIPRRGSPSRTSPPPSARRWPATTPAAPSPRPPTSSPPTAP